jgi:hypothetical protein
MADGTSKAIDEVRVGDDVANAEPDSDKTQRHTVTALHVTDGDRDFVDVSVGTPAGPKSITSTAHHRFWDATTHAWTNATDLEFGDQLNTPGDGHATVLTLRRYVATIRTYNLTVDAVHTYYVLAGNTPVLVHNCGTGEAKIVDQTLGAGAHASDGVGLVDGNINAPGVRGMVNEAGNATGCHTCGATNPGTRTGNWVPDHQPPASMVAPGTPQTAYPHCLPCARQQGGIVGQMNRGHYDFD